MIELALAYPLAVLMLILNFIVSNRYKTLSNEKRYLDFAFSLALVSIVAITTGYIIAIDEFLNLGVTAWNP